MALSFWSRAAVALAWVVCVLPASAQSAPPAATPRVDVLLVGGGIMSATLGVMLKELEPQWSMLMVERLDAVAQESSHGWNNAGTGHAGLAELNYTPEKDGRIEIAKAVEINEAFQVSRRFWASQVRRGVLQKPRSFIHSVPHMSVVWGDDNVAFLKKRHAALQAHPLFRDMRYSDDPAQIRQWAPLMMEGRDPQQNIAATWSPSGTDVDFGEITRQFVRHLQTRPGFDLRLSTEVRDIERNDDGTWRVTYAGRGANAQRKAVDAKFVFVGAGGGTLRLLQASGIPEARDYGAFPVGGSFLVSDRPDLAARHLAKAYGRAGVGSPPMSVPHLDTRMLDGRQVLLFGPFATFSTKFLKEGAYTDLFASLRPRNVGPMVRVGIDEFPLVQYLVKQVLQSDEDRFQALREYLPQARREDWKLVQAGQRVQIIQRDAEQGGVLKLGTEMVVTADGTLAGLLGASPGASTAAPIMLELLGSAFKDRMATPAWQARLQQMVPHYGSRLGDDPRRAYEQLRDTSAVLQLTPPALPASAAR